MKHVEAFNVSLLCIWRWRLINEREVVWKGLLSHRYGNLKLKMRSFEETNIGKKSSIRWRDIQLLGNKLTGNSNWFVDNVSCRLGNDNEISFWKHKWLGHQPFMLVFLNIFNRADNKDTKLTYFGEWNGNYWDRSLDSIREADPEDQLYHYNTLQEILTEVKTNCPIKDNVVWMQNVGGEFRVQNMYKTVLLSIYGKHMFHRK